MKLTMNQIDLAEWIQEASRDGLMLTISRPHARADHLAIESTHMEPIISRIVGLANRFVFGKHKRFDFLKGIVVQEGGRLFPHFHIAFQKPVAMDIDTFQHKLSQLATRLCDPDFEFDLSDSYLSKAYQRALTKPGFPTFARVSPVHERLGGYLTAECAKYFQIHDRSFNLQRDQIQIYVDFHNNQRNHSKEVAHAMQLFKSRQIDVTQMPVATTSKSPANARL